MVGTIVKRVAKRVQTKRLQAQAGSGGTVDDRVERDDTSKRVVAHAMDSSDVSNTVVANFGVAAGGASDELQSAAVLEGATYRPDSGISGLPSSSSGRVSSRAGLYGGYGASGARAAGRSARESGVARVKSLPPLKQAIVWTEILSLPVAERDPR